MLVLSCVRTLLLVVSAHDHGHHLFHIVILMLMTTASLLSKTSHATFWLNSKGTRCFVECLLEALRLLFWRKGLVVVVCVIVLHHRLDVDVWILSPSTRSLDICFHV